MYRHGEHWHVEIEVDWRKLLAPIRCALSGHSEPNDVGDCKRCGRDLLHLPPVQRMAVMQRHLNEHLTAHLNYLHRERP